MPEDGSRILVFDNASDDATAALVESTFPSVDLVRSEDNLGFARACNRAAGMATTEHILLLNPDAVVEPGCVDALLEAAHRHPDGALFGGQAIRPDGQVDPISCMGRPTMWSLVCFATGLSAAFPASRVLNPEGLGRWPRDTERQVDVLAGFLLLARRDVWDRLGGFDERFFMYGEDADLGLRVRALGYGSILAPDAKILHLGGGSSPALGKQVLLFRGKVTLVRKLWPGPAGSMAVTLLLAGVWLRARVAGSLRSIWPGSSARGVRTAPSTWAALWTRRREWRDGWPPPTD